MNADGEPVAEPGDGRAGVFDLHRLRLLRELKHRGTLAAVASALSYSPSSVSQQLSLLETEVGVPLLEPVGRRVRLTPQAEILVAHTEAVLARLERAEADIATSLSGLTGTLRIASFQTAALALVPAALTLLRAEHPALRVHVTQAEPETALRALLAGDFDLVVAEEVSGRAQRPPRRTPSGRPAPGPSAPCPARPAGGGRAADGRRPVRAARLCRAALGHGTARQRGPALGDHPVPHRGVRTDVRFESTDLLLHLRLVEQGHAVALLPDLVWGDREPSVRLVPLPRGRRARRLFTAVRTGRSTHPAILACRHALRQAAGPAEG